MHKKNKLCIILANNIFEIDGANANRWRSMIEGLSKSGVNIEIIITQGYYTFKEFKKYGRKGTIGDIPYTYTIFLLLNSFWMAKISRRIISPLLNKIHVRLLGNIINKIDPGIIWLHPTNEVMELYLSVKSRLSIQDYKLMMHLNEFDDVILMHARNKRKANYSKRFSSLLLREILPQTDLLVIMTRTLLEYYRQFTDIAKVRFLHLPMTVDRKRFDLERKSTVRYIAYCGSSNFKKDGVDILIQAFTSIAAKYPGLKLKIAAFMTTDEEKMLALINQLDLLKAIDYVGELKRDEIPDFITNAEVLLLPRPDSKQAQGGFPTKLGEYLSTGNPVCATRVGEIPDYLTDNENVFFAEPGNINSFADAMERALSNREKADEVGQNGKKVAALIFDMDVQAKRFAAFINGQEQ